TRLTEQRNVLTLDRAARRARGPSRARAALLERGPRCLPGLAARRGAALGTRRIHVPLRADRTVLEARHPRRAAGISKAIAYLVPARGVPGETLVTSARSPPIGSAAAGHHRRLLGSFTCVAASARKRGEGLGKEKGGDPDAEAATRSGDA